MGDGTWSSNAYNNYTKTTFGVSADTFSTANYSTQEIFKSRRLDPALNPYKVIRECCDSEEHPNSFPIILALDVTGSMGAAARKVAQKLNTLMAELYNDDSVQDPEFCVIAIGDIAYDDAPIQMTQFESDIRIAEQLDKVYFEAGGGGNGFESYSAAWYMGLYHTALDCWKRGKKGLIITMGDECPNPYISGVGLGNTVGDKFQGDVETKDLLEAVQEKFEIYHLSVDDEDTSYDWYKRHYNIDSKWRDLLGERYSVVTLDNLIPTIVNIIKENCDNNFSESFITISSAPVVEVDEDNYIGW